MATDVKKQQEDAGQAIIDRILRQYQAENPANAAQVQRLTQPATATRPTLKPPVPSKTGVLSPQEAAEMMRQLDAKKQQEFDEFTSVPIKKAKGGKVKAYAKGGSIRGGGIESRGKTKGRMV